MQLGLGKEKGHIILIKKTKVLLKIADNLYRAFTLFLSPFFGAALVAALFLHLLPNFLITSSLRKQLN
jgi:hypothetical protein